MRRVLLIVLGLVVVGAGGFSAFWFMNQGQVREQVRLALSEFERRGVATQYDAFEISGFPFSYDGSFRNLTATIASRNIAFSFPAASASVAFAEADTVRFTLPSEFTATVLDETGAPTGDVVAITSENLETFVTPDQTGAADLGLTADRVRLEPRIGGDAPRGFVELVTLAGSSRIEIDAAAGTGAIDLGMTAASVAFSGAHPTFPDRTTDIAGEGVVIDVEGDLSRLETALRAAVLTLDTPSEDPSGEPIALRVEGFSTQVEITPRERFEPGALLEATSVENALELAGPVILRAVLDGGALDYAVSADMIAANGAAAGSATTFESAGFGYAIELSPETAGFRIDADTFKLDVSGPQRFAYDLSDVAMSIAATAAETFDFAAALEAATPEEGFQTALLEVRDELSAGGSAEVRVATGSGVTIAGMAGAGLPFDQISSATGPNETIGRVDADFAALSITGEDIRYGLAGAVSGEAALETYAMTWDFPLKAADEPQTAEVDFSLSQITMDESLWALFDPEARMPREIEGLRIDADIAMQVTEDVWTMDPNAVAPPMIPVSINLADSFLSLMGLRVEASGAVAMVPAPNGAFSIALQGWKPFVENLSATALGQDPQAATFLLIADQQFDVFGETDPATGITTFDVAIGQDGAISVNGRPVQ